MLSPTHEDAEAEMHACPKLDPVSSSVYLYFKQSTRDKGNSKDSGKRCKTLSRSCRHVICRLHPLDFVKLYLTGTMVVVDVELSCPF